ncbi:MAG: hypothetical protein ACRC5A_03450 [Enterobacteriaceae bacterium]
MLGYRIELDRALLLLLPMIFLFNYKWFKFYLLIISLITALYFPTGLFYGSPGLSIVAAIWETHGSEAREFLKDIPWWIYPGSLLYLLLTRQLYRLKYQKFNINRYIILTMVLVASVLPAKSLIHSALSDGEPQRITLSGLLGDMRIVLLELPVDSYQAVRTYQQERQKLELQRTIAPSWRITGSHGMG